MALKDRIIEIAYELKNKFSNRVREVTSSIRSVETASDKSSAKIERNNKRTGDSFGFLSKGANRAKVAIAAVAAFVAGATAAVGRFIAAANNQERAETKLATTLTNLTGARADQIQALKDQAASLQQLTGYGDEATLSAQAQLATFKLNAEQIQQLTPGLLDMAESQRKLGNESVDLESIALALGKAFTSGVGSLSRYGVALTDAQKEAFKLADQQGKVDIITSALKDNFDGLAAAVGKTYDGASRRAAAAKGDAEEVAGALFTQNRAFINFQDAIAKGWEALGRGLRGSATEIGQVITVLVGSINVGMQSIRVAFNVTQVAIKSAAFFINKSIALILRGIEKITFGDVSDTFRKMADEVESYAEDLRESIGEDVADIAASVETMSTAFDTEMEKSSKATEKAQKKITDANAKVVQALDGQIETVKKNKEAYEENAKALEKSLADSKSALQKSVNDAKSVKAEFQKLIDDIRSGPGKAKEDLTILDFDQDLRNAKKALQEGDFDGAIEGARKAADTLRAMQESGKESALVLGGPGGLADQLAKLANEAADKKVESGEQAVKSVEEQLEAMQLAAKGAAEAIKDLEQRKIEISTNTEKSVQNLKDTQAAMQRQADGQPIVQPVVTDDPQAQLNALFEQERKINAGEIDIDTAPAEQKLVELNQANTAAIEAARGDLQAKVDQPMVQKLVLDTSEAERELAKIEQRASKPLSRKVFVNEAGNSFTDRPLNGYSELELEALGKGSRR